MCVCGTPCGPSSPSGGSVAEKSAKKLTQNWQIDIVRRFREYPGRTVGETRRVKRVEKSPSNRRSTSSQDGNTRIALYWIQEIHRRISLIFDQNVVSLRPIAIVPATPSTLDGLCGPEQRNGVGSSLEVEERRSATVDCLRLVCCIGLQTQQGRSSSETLQRSQFFACTE